MVGINIDGLAKSQNLALSVIPAKARIQEIQQLLDPGFRRGDDLETFCEAINIMVIAWRGVLFRRV